MGRAVGKWTARLAEKTGAPPREGTDETDKRGLLSVLAVTPGGGAGEISAAPMPACAPLIDCTDLAAMAWTDADIARFLDRRARLLRWGWADADAERTAERLVIRDRGGDVRVSCTECMHYRPGRCGNHKAAALLSPEVGRDLAALLQRCPGFSA